MGSQLFCANALYLAATGNLTQYPPSSLEVLNRKLLSEMFYIHTIIKARNRILKKKKQMIIENLRIMCQGCVIRIHILGHTVPKSVCITHPFGSHW